MEYGPASRTRSTKSVGKVIESATILKTPTRKSEDNEVFKTPSSNSQLKKSSKRKNRTPSGQQLSKSVEDIRDFFSKKLGIEARCEESKSANSVKRKVFKDSQSLKDYVSQRTVKETRETTDAESVNIEPLSLIEDLNDLGTHDTSYEHASDKQTPKSVNRDLPTTESDKKERRERITQELKAIEDHRRSNFKSSECVNSDIADNREEDIEITQSDKNNHPQLSDEMDRYLGIIYKDMQMKRLIRRQVSDERHYREQRQERINTAKIEAAKKVTTPDIPEQNFPTDEAEKQVMDVKLVFQMFKELKQDIAGSKVIDGEKRLDDIEERQDKTMDEVLSAKEQLLDQKTKVHVLEGLVTHLSEKLTDMDNRVEKIEFNHMRKSFVFSGLNCQPKKDVCLNELYNFFSEEMKLEIQIDDLFFLNKGKSSPVVATTSTIQEKISIMSNASSLKDLRNNRGQSYYINDYLPPGMNERKRRHLDIIKGNNDLGEDKLQMIRRGGSLTIEGQPYVKRVHVPTVKEIVALTTEDFNTILDTKLTEGVKVPFKDDYFHGYTMATNNFEEVQKAYTKLKILFPNSKHIVCAYMLPGTKEFECEDFCDDEEHSSGRVLLQWMQKHKLECRAIYVTRNAKGAKLGTDRFQCYIDAAKNAIAAHPINDINNQNQLIIEVEEENEGQNQQIQDERPPPIHKQRNSRGTRSGYGHHSRSFRRGSQGVRGRRIRGYPGQGYPRSGYTRRQMKEHSDRYQEAPEYSFASPERVNTEWPTPYESERLRTITRNSSV